MKLQLALDVASTKDAMKIIEETYDYVDILEVGTPLIMAEGLNSVKAIKNAFPAKTVLADMKIMDGAGIMAAWGYDAGADIVTVQAFTHDYTVRELVRVAHERGKLAEVDLMCIKNHKERAEQLMALDVDIICYHGHAESHRPNEVNMYEIKKMLEVVPKEKFAVANCLSFENLENVLKLQPEIVVVSGPILGAENMREAAKTACEIFDGYR